MKNLGTSALRSFLLLAVLLLAGCGSAWDTPPPSSSSSGRGNVTVYVGRSGYGSGWGYPGGYGYGGGYRPPPVYIPSGPVAAPF